MAVPVRSIGDDREDHATDVGIAVAAVYQAAELALLDALAMAVRRALRLGGAVTQKSVTQLRQAVAVVMAAAERRVRKTVEDAGVPFDYQPVIPAGDDQAADFIPADIPAPSTPAGLPPGPVLAAETGQATGPSIRQMIEQASVRVGREIPNLYQQAVAQAIADTRGGLPASSLSLSRIQAAQKALDFLTERGITAFTDRAGRNWDLASYIEMATRTAVSNAWDNTVAAAVIRSGNDLIETYTHSLTGSCPRCIPWLFRTLSLTGQTPGYPTLMEARAAGFRHPNCRCSWVGKGMGEAAETTSPVPPDQAAAAYQADQRQRLLERKVRAAGRRAAVAQSAGERRRAERDLAAARAASAAHRTQHRLRMTQASVRRREHPWDAH